MPGQGEQRRRLQFGVERGDVDLLGEAEVTLDVRIGRPKLLLALPEFGLTAVRVSVEKHEIRFGHVDRSHGSRTARTEQ